MSKNPIDKLSGFCVVTGGSSGIGFELAKLAAEDGCDLLIVADRDLEPAGATLRDCGAASVKRIEADLGTEKGIENLMNKIGERDVDVLVANAGHGFGDAFFLQQWKDVAHVIDTNIKGTVSLVHKVGARMVLREQGRILVTGSIAGHIPRRVSGGLQFDQGLRERFLRRLGERDQAHRRRGFLPDARRDRFAVLRARRDGRHVGRADGPQVRSGKGRARWLSRASQRRDARG